MDSRNLYRTFVLARIRAKVRKKRYEFSRHALDQSLRRGIGIHEFEEALARGEIIEEYPDDKYGPSCLILGFTRKGRPLHMQCSLPERNVIKVITLYEPDPSFWLDYRHGAQHPRDT